MDSDFRTHRGRLRGFSINRLIPNVLTLAALCSGLTAIRFGLQGQMELAVIAIFVAAVLDALDGRVARRLGVTSRFGAELDSLSDFLCFGVAPALVLYMASLKDAGALGWIVTLMFPMCSALRLARFNTALVSRCEGYFKSLGQKLNMIDVSNDVAQIKTRTAAALQADPSLNALLAVGPHVCEAAAAAVDEVGAKVHLSCFDMTPGVINLIKAKKVAFTIDQQQRLQGYLPVILLHLYNTNAGMLPGANVPSGPGFVDAKNADAVASQAGVNR